MFIINPLVFAFSVLTILIVFLIDNYNIYKTKKLKKEKKIIQEKILKYLIEKNFEYVKENCGLLYKYYYYSYENKVV